MTRHLILGAGRFGRIALRRLFDREPESEFWLVDSNPKKLIFGSVQVHPDIHMVTAAGTDFLAAALEWPKPPDWIIPAIPRHVAFDWLWHQRPAAAGWQREPVPPEVGRDLPFAQIGVAGELYLSLSTERCPDDCPEPAEGCYLTGAQRIFNLYNYLENLSIKDYTSLVIRSRQLAPGVGGFRPVDLWQLRDTVQKLESRMLISTACRCHGVTHGLHKLTGKGTVVGI